MIGHRVGTKRSDRRWEDDNGVWASKLEADIFASLRGNPSVTVRRCEPGSCDTVEYQSPVRSGKCLACGHRTVVQVRTYTPDFFVVPRNGPTTAGYHVEIKGYLSAADRTILRDVKAAWPNLDLRVLLQRDGKCTPTKSRVEWTLYTLKAPVAVWDGRMIWTLPQGYNDGKPTTTTRPRSRRHKLR